MPLMWTIRLRKQYKIVSEFEVPDHRLGKDGLQNLLRAIFVSNIADDPEAMVPFYINKRRGNPERSSMTDLRRGSHPETRERGFYCGYPELLVEAMIQVSQEDWDWTEARHAENRGSSEAVG